MNDQLITDIRYLENSICNLISEFERKTSLRVSNVDYVKKEYEGEGLLSTVIRKVIVSVKVETIT